jgi:oligoendopeptidase F
MTELNTSLLPAWDNSKEYKSIDDKQFQDDLRFVEETILKIDELSLPLSQSLELGVENWNEPDQLVTAAQSIGVLANDLGPVISNLFTYISLSLSRNAKDEQAELAQSTLQNLYSKFSRAMNPHSLYLVHAPEKAIEQYLNHGDLKPSQFHIKMSRQKRPFLLSLPQENLISSLAMDGHKAWGKLYTKISSTLSTTLELGNEKKVMSLTEASELIQSPDRDMRQAAYKAIDRAWESQEQTCAAILNSLSGWRLKMNEERSQIETLHYLDDSLHHNHMKKETLDAVFSAIEDFRERTWSALKLVCHILGEKQIHPWDLSAPCPASSASVYQYPEAIQMVKDSCKAVHPDMEDFIKIMDENHWIDAEKSENRRPGAYCTKFAKSRNPRVFTNYGGQFMSVRTLAHELGHAWHNWCMRELPLSQASYPMVLAESASLFGEQLLNQWVHENGEDQDTLKAISYHESLMAVLYLLNIPVRFDFENQFYSQRQSKEFSASDFKSLMSKTWMHWYGEQMGSANEYFWASKMHFYIADLSFYNYPYFFGYVLSQGLFKKWQTMGSKEFFPVYCDFLRDTGRMTVEELIATHFKADSTNPLFWKDCLSVVETKLQNSLKIWEQH